MTDIHCHILYGLDDGAQSLQESKRMLSAARKMGIERMIATPHVKHMPYDLEEAKARYREVREYAAQKGIELNLGFEVHWNALHALKEQELDQYCFQGTRTMLVEFSLSADELPQDHDQMIYRVQREGLHIIIAHPERYRFVQKDLFHAERWKDLGCDLQLDAICLMRAYEPMSKITARKLLKANRYDFFASDAHCAEDYEAYSKALNWAERHS